MDTTALPLVIVPIDGSPAAERAVQPAVAIASRAGARILLLSARFGPDDGTRLGYLKRVASEVTVPSTTRLVEDQLTHNAIVDTAQATPGSLLMMSTHARGAIGQALLGSVTEDVLRHYADAVLLVGPASCASAKLGAGPVLVCSDGSAHAAFIVPSAVRLARQLGIDAALVVEVSGGPAADATVALAAAMQDAGLTTATQVVAGSDPAVALAAIALEADAPFVAMATHGRTGLERITIGSVTSALVRTAPCPVLVRRPDRFETPAG